MTIPSAKDEARKAAANRVFEYADEAPHPDIGEEDAAIIADAAISAYEAALESAGLVLVPREATEAMLFGSREAWTSPLAQLICNSDSEASFASVEKQGREIWSAMIAAASPPRPNQQPEQNDHSSD